MTRPLPTLLLPGLDGTGLMFRRFVEELPPSIESHIVSYPPDRLLGYDELEGIVEAALPPDGPFAIVAESFSGPLAIRIAAKRPRGLVAMVLVATFARAPIGRWSSPARRVATRALFAIPPPAFAVRALLMGSDASDAAMAELRSALRAVRPSVLAMRVRSALDVDVSSHLARSRVRLLHVEAGQDALLRRGAAGEMKQLRRDVKLVSIPAPHLVLQCRPREAAATIVPFLLAKG